MAFWGKNNEKKSENNVNKEKNMNEYKNSLDYKKVNDAFNKVNNKNNANYDSLKSNIENLFEKFNNLSNDEKQEELKSKKFQETSIAIKNLKFEDNKLKDIKKIIEEMENHRELSEYENLSKQIENLASKLDMIEKENSQSQDDIAEMVQSKKEIDKIAKIIDNSFWNRLKESIQIPKVDLSSITQKIESLKKDLQNNKNDINNSNRELAKKIDNIKFPAFPTPPKIPNNYLKKEDFEFTINDKLKDLKEIKESSEDLEAVPAKVNIIEKKIDDLSEKLENLPSSNSSQTPKYIPTEEKSVIELAKYMTDGVAQFENIAKEYISRISELEKLDKIKEEHKKELKKIREEEFTKGKKEGKIELIEKLAEDFPTKFKDIQSIFEDLLKEKFKKDDVLDIDDSNIDEMRSSIEDKIENGQYKVLSSAILLDNKTLFKATVEKVDVEKADA